MSIRLETDQRRSVIITAAVRIARERGLGSVTQGDVAKRCSVPTTVKTVRHYFTRNDLWHAVALAHPDEFEEAARELGVWK